VRWRINVNDIGGNVLGKVKTEQIKRIGKELMVRFPDKFSSTFDENEQSVDLLTQGTTTRVRNQVAGYITRTISLAQAGSVNESVIDEEIEE
jgi:small subunit ribosomal protein S17e